MNDEQTKDYLNPNSACVHHHFDFLQLSYFTLDILIYFPKWVRFGLKCYISILSSSLVKTKRLSRMKFSIQNVPESSISAAILAKELNSREFDLHRVVCLHKNVIRALGLRDFQWIKIRKIKDGAKDDEKLDSTFFHCMALCTASSTSEDTEEKQIQMTSVCHFNLKNELGIYRSSHEDEFTISIHCCPLVKARTLKISLIRAAFEIEDDLLFEKWFKKFLSIERYLQTGNIYPLAQYTPSQINSDESTIYFKVVEIELFEPEDKKEIVKDPGIYSAFEYTSVFYLERINHFVPPKLFLNNLESQELCPPSLMPHFTELLQIVQSVIFKPSSGSSFWPNVMISGAGGSGKSLLCKSIAQRLGMNFYHYNSAHLIGDSSSYSEGKLKSLAQKAKALSPCLIILKNIHLLGKDKEDQENKRFVAAFLEFLQGLEIHSREGVEKSATFLFGLSNEKPEKVIASISNCFLHKMNLDKSSRSRTKDGLARIREDLAWLQRKCRLNIQIDMEKFLESSNSHRSPHSYLFSDLKHLLGCALRNALKENDNNLSNGEIPIRECHMKSAFDELEVDLQSSKGRPEIPKVSWEDIGGMENVKSELVDSFQLPLKFPHLFSKGLKRSGILLYGPPGCGKTLVAKAIASEFNLNFLSVKGPELLNMYVGQSEQNVRDVFDKAREAAPCIIFFDELDSLAPNRGKSGDSGGVMDRVVSQLLAEMDGTHSSPNIFIVGATNRPDLLDSALLRPGRFDKLLYVGISEDQNSKEKILRALTRKFNFAPNVNLSEIAKNLPAGMTGADLYAFSSDAFLSAISRRIDLLDKKNSTADQESPVQVSMLDLRKAMKRVSVSLSDKDHLKYQNMAKMNR